MKPGRIIGIILGAALIYFSVGAYFSSEPAAQTDTGRIMIFVAGAFGILTLLSNLFQTKSTSASQIPTLTTSAVPTEANKNTCYACKRPIEAAFQHCPHCGVRLHLQCPSCGKEVSPEFNVCPYCATTLKQ